MINFFFDDLEELRNCFDESETFESGMTRITTSPYANQIRRTINYYSNPNNNLSLVEFFGEKYNITLTDSHESISGSYIVPIGVNQETRQWIGRGYTDDSVSKNFIDLFDKINVNILGDLMHGKAFLLIDNSLEGYHDDCLFDYLHNGAVDRNFSPNQIIYVTGNSNIENRLEVWKSNNIDKTPIHVIPYCHFEFDISEKRRLLEDDNQFIIPSYKTQLDYKTKNLENIKSYNFLNKKPREHRAWFFDILLNWNLLDDGIVTMNKYSGESIEIDYNRKNKKDIHLFNKKLPMYAYDDNTEDKPFSYYMYNYNQQATLDSWFSIISETHFEDKQGTIFLSEKTFKTIACNHPFIVLGNKNSLKELHKLGYKTFNDLIDEQYDEMDSISRMESIANFIRDFNLRPNKLEWFKWLEEKIKYNSNVLRFNSLFKPPSGFFLIKKLLEDANKI